MSMIRERVKGRSNEPKSSAGPLNTVGLRGSIVSIAIFSSAMVARIWQMADRGIDYYGDSYHHWLIGYLTATNGYAYTDFKQKTMNIVWLPLYHYINAFLMSLTGIYDLTVPHALNIILGSLTCVVAYRLVKRLYGGEILGIAAASALALQPWFMNLNTLALTENLSCFLIVLAIYYYFQKRPVHFIAPVILAMLTRYEAWLFAALLIITAFVQRKFGVRWLILLICSAGVIIAGWCFWSYVNTSDPLAWYRMQVTMVEWDVRYFQKTGAFNLSRLKDFLTLALNMTSWFLPIGLAAGLLKKAEIRTIAILELVFIVYVNLQVFVGTSLPEPRYLIYILPLTSILLVSILGGVKLKRSYVKKAIYAAFLLAIIILPLRDVRIFPAQTYVIKPEMEAGLALAALYNGGGVVSDSPTVIYYSKIEPSKFHSSLEIRWYARDWSREKLKEWYLKNGIRFMVWQNVTYSSLWWLFPELSEGRNRVDSTDPKAPITYSVEYTKVYHFGDKTVRIHIYGISF